MDRSRFRYGLEQGPDGLPIEDFEIMPSLGVSFGIVTGPLRIPVIGCWASPNLTIFMLFERLGVVVISTHAFPFNRFGRNYEICEWAPSSYNGQTTRGVAVMKQGQLARFDFYQTTESRYYAPVAAGIWCTNWELGCDSLGIHGHAAVLSAEERGVFDKNTHPQLPLYDLSWVLDEGL